MLDKQLLDRHALDRGALRARYLANRARTKELFDLIAPQAYYDRPIPLRLPLVFYEGHIPAFSFNTLPRKALGAPLLHGEFETLFERGIDPASETEARTRGAHAWPERPAVAAFARACDAAVLAALERPGLERSDSPLLERGEAVYAILEHEEMHQETLLYLIHQLASERKNVRRPAARLRERAGGERPRRDSGRDAHRSARIARTASSAGITNSRGTTSPSAPSRST